MDRNASEAAKTFLRETLSASRSREFGSLNLASYDRCSRRM
jgi:hypothetical protein